MIAGIKARVRRARLKWRLDDTESRIEMVERAIVGLEYRLEHERDLLLRLRAQRTRYKALVAGAGMSMSNAMEWRAPL